jgi:MoaA/NifB/PqqE/SkfB family radical SAM enzyme/SAM-dependent methyltransferase
MNTPLFLPRTIGIELVRGCNFDCEMCPVTSNAPLEQDKFQFIDLDLLEMLAAEIDRWPSIETIWFFHFGEPLAHPHFRKCLEILNRSAVAHRAVVIQHTNASLLNGDKAEAVLDIPIINKLVFSFDGFGDKESFERLRGPHFDRVLANIEQFSEQARSRCPDLVLAACTILPQDGEVPGLAIPSRSQVRQQLSDLFSPLGVGVEIRDMHDYSGNDDLAIKGKRPEQVFGGCIFVELDSLYFTVNGWAQPCCAVYDENLNIGNLAEHSFGDLLNNSRMNRIRHALRLDQREPLPFCKNCALSIGGDLNAESLKEFWKERDRQGGVHDLEERRYIFGTLAPTEHTVVRLDLGCGMGKPAGFIGLDRSPMPGVDVAADLDKPLPFASNSVDLVLASHSLEHVENLTEAIKEIYRVCKHRAQVCIVSPYSQQSLNLANPYHLQAFNEHTPRFWTDSPRTGVEAAEYVHPHAHTWGLSQSDHGDPGVDFRCLRIEFFYFPEYRQLSPEERRSARQKYLNVCDQIMYHLVVIKQPMSEVEMQELANQFEYYEPSHVVDRKCQERCEDLEVELAQTREELESCQEELLQLTEDHREELLRLTEDHRAELEARQTEVVQIRSQARLISDELDSYRHRRVIRWLRRLRDRSDLSNEISPTFQQLKDDSLIFTPTLKGYQLQPSVNLSRVPFLAYPLELNRPNLTAVHLAPLLDLPSESGRLGIEIVSLAGQIVAQVTVPLSEVSATRPTCFNFAPIPGSDQGRHWLRVFVRDADMPVRVFEWRKYRLFGLGRLQTGAFCGFVFNESE